MAPYGLILCQNEAYHFQKAFPIAPGPPGSIENSKIAKNMDFRPQGFGQEPSQMTRAFSDDKSYSERHHG